MIDFSNWSLNDLNNYGDIAVGAQAAAQQRVNAEAPGGMGGPTAHVPPAPPLPAPAQQPSSAGGMPGLPSVNPLSFLNMGGGSSGGAGGAGGMGSFAGPLTYAYLIGKGKMLEHGRLQQNPNDPLGNFSLAMLGPSASQIFKDPVGMGLPTLFGLPFITPFTSSDKSKQAAPEWAPFFKGLFGG